jgi:hypothetical protein
MPLARWVGTGLLLGALAGFLVALLRSRRPDPGGRAGRTADAPPPPEPAAAADLRPPPPSPTVAVPATTDPATTDPATRPIALPPASLPVYGGAA